MVDLTVSKEEREKEREEFEKGITHYESEIPYGLHIHLDNRELEKLGLLDRKVEVGTEMMATVKLRVTGLSENETEEKKRRHVDMAIVEMDFDTEDKREKAKTVLYG